MRDGLRNDSGKPVGSQPKRPKGNLIACRLEQLGEEVARNNEQLALANKAIGKMESELAALVKQLAKPKRRSGAATSAPRRVTHSRTGNGSSRTGNGRRTPERSQHLHLVGDVDSEDGNCRKSQEFESD